MYELALFAGAGGGILGGKLCGFDIIGAVEIEEYPREVLKQRQRDGHLPEFPIWDDVTTFRIDNPECRQYIEKLKSIKDDLIITGGFPCQDISSAGKGAGITKDTRSGLWFEYARIINEIRPARVLVENSPVLTSRGLGIVLGDLAEMGYDAKWGVLGAVDVGAPHKRERIWIVADSKKLQCDGSDINKENGKSSTSEFRGCNGSEDVADSMHKRLQRGEKIGDIKSCGSRCDEQFTGCGELPERSYWTTEPALDRVANGVAKRVDRLKAIGNGQVPAVVRAVWEILR